MTLNNQPKLLMLAVLALSMLGLGGCYYDVESELYPGSQTCDTTGVTFSGTVQPIMNQSCAVTGCHTSSARAGGYVLETHAGVLVAVNNGRFMGSIRWEDVFSNMPKNGSQLDDCLIEQLQAWVNAGAPNN